MPSLKDIVISFTGVIPDLVLLIVGIVASFIYLFLSPLLYIANVFSTKQFPEPKTIVITGASSGIGRSLAIRYAKKGKVLALTGRSRERLQEVANKCIAKGATVEIGELDVTDQVGMSKWLKSVDHKSPVDLIIANAGVSEFVLGDKVSYEEKTYQLTNTNVMGVLNTIFPLLNTMRERMHGQIVIVGSLSTYIKFLFPAYVGSKCWVRGYATTLRQELAPYGIGVSLISPGFVDTGMTESLPKDMTKIGMLSPDVSAQIFQAGISENKAHITDANLVHSIVYFLSVLPLNLKDGVHFISKYIYPSGSVDTNTMKSSTSSTSKKLK